MSGIQSGDGAARTNAEDEEHKPFSHDLPSSRGERLRERFYMLLTHLRQVAAVRRMRGGLGLTLRRRSLAVRLDPCQGGSGFGDDPCDRRPTQSGIFHPTVLITALTGNGLMHSAESSILVKYAD